MRERVRDNINWKGDVNMTTAPPSLYLYAHHVLLPASLPALVPTLAAALGRYRLVVEP